MEIEIKGNKLHRDNQTITFDGNTLTLIGENGSGKSSILESIFEDYLENPDVNVICFTSGQNELFSTLFNKFKSKSKRYLKEEDTLINSFYFNYDWVRTLVFFASHFKPDGNVRNYLTSKNYIEVDEYKTDLSSSLYLRFGIKKTYSIKIHNEIEREGTEGFDFEEKLLRKSEFHSTLEKILDSFGIPYEYENRDYLMKRTLKFSFDNVFNIFTHKDVNKIFTFLALAAHGYEANINIDDCSLVFDNNIEFSQLSDGEYQLLSIYALMDLFDNENTIFLFDEIDSHLYYKNIGKLWDIISKAKGKIITTTHVSESILKNDFNDLKFIQNGKVENDLTLKELAERLSAVVGIQKYEYNLASRTEYVILIDDETDWLIFKKLAVKKLGDVALNTLNKIIPFKRSSSYDKHNEIFGKSKLLFVKEFKELYLNKEKKTKSFFLLCDRDKLSKNSIDAKGLVQIHQDYRDLKSFDNIQTFLISWRRLEIENYLISYTMLNYFGALDQLRAKFGHINFVENMNFDGIADIEEYDAKALLHPLYKVGSFDETKLDLLISKIPVTEISNDIVSLYQLLKTELDK
jgi:ABC-type multidrug transport system ATPase subunit